MPTKKKPIYVSNPNDSRLRAYQDSLGLYNKGEATYANKKKEVVKNINDFNESQSVISGLGNLFSGEKYNARYKERTTALSDKEKDSLISPIKRTIVGDDNRQNFQLGNYKPEEHGEKPSFNLFDIVSRYKKPEQPYIYKKVEEKIKKEKKPYILKREKKKIKKNIIPTPVKESIPKDTIPIIEPVVKPQVEKEPEPTVPKKLPGGSGPFARYPNMKGQLNNVKTSRMVNAKKVKNIVPTFADGVKKLSYKEWKDALPDNLRAESKLYNLRGAYEGGLEPELNEDGTYHLGSRNPRTGEILKSPAHNTFKQAIDTDRKLGYIPLVKPDGKVYTQNPEEQTYVSGAKSVKQYRGDENLPEAKNGMKKGCGCKHSKSKYKYQDGTDDLNLEVDNDPEIIELNRKLKEVNDRVFKKTPVKPVEKPVEKTTPVPEKKVIAKVQTPIQKPKAVIPVTKPLRTVQKTIVKSIPKKVIEKTKSISSYKRPAELEALYGYKKFDSKIDSLNKVSNLTQDKKRYETSAINYSKQKFLQNLPQKQQDFINTYYQAQTRKQDIENIVNENKVYKKELFNKNKKNFEKSADVKRYEEEKENKKLNPSFIDSMKYVFSKKYKYGTGALTIPEGSAIVTANGGKNKQALKAYKKGNYKLLNNIIDDMPEDNVSKKQAGDQSVAPSLNSFKFKQKTAPAPKLTETDPTRRRYQELAQKGELTDAEQDEFVNLRDSFKDSEDIYTDERIAKKQGEAYDKDDPKNRSYFDAKGNFILKEDKDNAKYREQLRDKTFRDAEIKKGNVVIKNGEIHYKAKGVEKPGQMEFLGTTASTTPNVPEGGMSYKPNDWITPNKSNTSQNDDITKDNSGDNKNKGGGRNRFGNIPSLAEVAARGSILAQGVEGVPENYLKLGRYNYASQLDRTLRENAVAANTAKENIRDVSGGSAGSYLSNVANITAKRFDANAGAVTQDTLARQDVLNKNVDLGNTEATVNTGLKNQFATQRSMNRGAYNNQLIALGQGIDTAVDASKLMSSQRDSDDVRTNLLKSGNYYMDKEGNVKMNTAKKGAKKLKTYKRK
jgi:hypothetical protein